MGGEKTMSKKGHNDRHMNLFYSYVRPTCEDNVTRSLIVLLDHLPTEITTAFLRKFCSQELPAIGRDAEYEYDLQNLNSSVSENIPGYSAFLLPITESKDPLWTHYGKFAGFADKANKTERDKLLSGLENDEPESRNKLAKILKLSPEKSKETDIENAMSLLREGHNSEERESRPDGWIIDKSGKLVIVIEAKKFGPLSKDQLRNHRANLKDKIKGAVSQLEPVKWSDIYRFFKEIPKGEIKESGATLLEDFLGYQRLCGFAPFDGFKGIDFDIDDDAEGVAKNTYPWRMAWKFIDSLDKKIKEKELPLSSAQKKREAAPAWQFDFTNTVGNLAVDFYGSSDAPIRLLRWWIGKWNFMHIARNAEYLRTRKQEIEKIGVTPLLQLKFGIRNNAWLINMPKARSLSIETGIQYLKAWRQIIREGDDVVRVNDLPLGKPRRERVEEKIAFIEKQLKNTQYAIDPENAYAFAEKIEKKNYSYKYYNFKPRFTFVRRYRIGDLEECDGNETVERVAEDMSKLTTLVDF